MHFSFTDDQRDIQRIAREILSTRTSPAHVRAVAEIGEYDSALWVELCELGWPGIGVAESAGGAGLGILELQIIAEELGYAIAGTPFLSSALASDAIQTAGSDEQRARWLPGLASGETLGTVAIELGNREAKLVPDADAAAVIVALAPDGSAGRLVTREEAVVTLVRTVDPTRRYGDVTLAAGEPLDAAKAGTALDRIVVVVAAELVGICQRALDMGVAYVKERRQFGTPVGAFQAVSHRCAEMLRDTETARSATYYAGWAADAGDPRLSEASALAKVSASDAGRAVTGANIQIHGGVGFTWEADAHWLFKRALLDSNYLGGPDAYRGRLARLVARRLNAERARYL